MNLLSIKSSNLTSFTVPKTKPELEREDSIIGLHLRKKIFSEIITENGESVVYPSVAKGVQATLDYQVSFCGNLASNEKKLISKEGWGWNIVNLSGRKIILSAYP